MKNVFEDLDEEIMIENPDLAITRATTITKIIMSQFF